MDTINNPKFSEQLAQIYGAIETSQQIDFSQYSEPLSRLLIEDFIEHFSLDGLEDLVEKVKLSEYWSDKLSDYLLVPDPELMRDPTFWRYLRDELLPSYKTNIRVLFPELNSGEELYSFLIALNESKFAHKIQIEVFTMSERKKTTIENGFIFSKNFSHNSDNYSRYQGNKNIETYFNFTNTKAFFKVQFLQQVHIQQQSILDLNTSEAYNLIIYRNKMLNYNDLYHAKAMRKIYTALQNKSHLCIGLNETLNHSTIKFGFTDYHSSEKIYKKRLFDGL